MDGAIFLSAGVPDPSRGPEYAKTADTVAITAAVSALLHVTLGRRRLVWGGQPAITPMIWAIAADMGVDYGAWVTLYQSKFFKDDFPEENEHFRNVTYTDLVDDDLKKSLYLMRERMFTESEFASAVFIGGMGGILDEFDLLKQFQPKATPVPIVSAGGAAALVAERIGTVGADLRDDLDFVSLFHRHLHISEKELRYPTPADQPGDVAQRYWTKPAPPPPMTA